MRTQVAQVNQSTRNGRWSVSFTVYGGLPGQEYISGELESAMVFNTEAEAHAGGQRALDVLEKTGRFPNMCEPF